MCLLRAIPNKIHKLNIILMSNQRSLPLKEFETYLCHFFFVYLTSIMCHCQTKFKCDHRQVKNNWPSGNISQSQLMSNQLIKKVYEKYDHCTWCRYTCRSCIMVRINFFRKVAWTQESFFLFISYLFVIIKLKYTPIWP